MIFTLIILALLIAVMISQSTQGLFGALMMTVLTIVCATAAVGTHEWIANNWIAPFWKPDYAMPIALGATFGVSLILLRVLFDYLIRRACLLPAWADRIGGGICGAVTAMTMVGVLVLCLRMIPFEDGSILGYARITPQRPGANTGPAPSASDETEARELLLRPDRFVTGVTSVVSSGVLSGTERFDAAYPDFVEAISWVSAVPAEVSRYARPRSISLVRTAPVDFVFRMTPADERTGKSAEYEPERPASGRVFRMVRVNLRAEARDERRSHLFALRQFRLVGQTHGDLEQYHPIAIQQEDAADPQNRHIRFVKHGRDFWPVTDLLYEPRDTDNHVEMVFELPESFTPTFLEYKRQARIAVSFRDDVPPPPGETRPPERAPDLQPPDRTATVPPDDAPDAARDSRRRRPPQPPPEPPDQQRGRRGRVRAVTVADDGSRFSDRLPMSLRAYRRITDGDVVRGALVNGHLIAEVDQQETGSDPPVERFEVPEHQRLLQLSSRSLPAGSLFGRALSQAVRVAQNYFVIDERGRQYKIVGKYAIADVRGRSVLEVQYFPEPVGTIGGVGPLQQINEAQLTADDRYYLLFLVDPGARIVAFSTGGAATRRDDLAGENLVAPPP